jgi:small subunit ribosomal protein S5
VAGLQSLRTPDEVAELRGLSINQVLGVGDEPQAAETLSGAPAAEAVANGTTEAAEEAAGPEVEAPEAPPGGAGEEA